MPNEAEKRKHRCCFSGHRPEKLDASEDEVKKWLGLQIDAAIVAGFRTFICGMGMGVDIWAGEIVLERREKDSSLHLICAVPWPGFPNRWGVEWQKRYKTLLHLADLVVPVSHQYKQDVFRKRNEWMVDHSSRLIAYYNGAPGGTQETITYALQQGVEVNTNNPECRDKPGRPRKSDIPDERDEHVQETFFRDDFDKTVIAQKTACTEEMKYCLREQKSRYPLMNEEDVVKFAFQGMMGIGHLVHSAEDAVSRLQEEMAGLEPDMEEPLVETISTNWVRINLRAAAAMGRTPEELAYQMFLSARMNPLSFTRQDVYDFCVELDRSEVMKAAAVKVLDENWLPRHSEAYRKAYAPAYRVMYKNYMEFSRKEEAEG